MEVIVWDTAPQFLRHRLDLPDFNINGTTVVHCSICLVTTPAISSALKVVQSMGCKLFISLDGEPEKGSRDWLASKHLTLRYIVWVFSLTWQGTLLGLNIVIRNLDSQSSACVTRNSLSSFMYRCV
jgi:hypothetical protein